MKSILLRLKGVLIAVVALALSAGLAFAGQPPVAASWGLANAAAHSGKTVPHQAVGDETSAAGDEDAEGDEDTEVDEDAEVDETTDEDAEVDENAGDETVDATVDEASDNCLTDPTVLMVEELATMSHGSIVCWAAHQTTWPEEFRNHGAWVSSWAHLGKGTEAANAKVKTHDVAKTKVKTKVHKNR